MEAARLHIDDPVDVREEGGRVVIEPLLGRSYELGELVAAITPENLHAEVGTGPAVGNEAW